MPFLSVTLRHDGELVGPLDPVADGVLLRGRHDVGVSLRLGVQVVEGPQDVADLVDEVKHHGGREREKMEIEYEHISAHCTVYWS